MRLILVLICGAVLGIIAGAMYGYHLGNGTEWSIESESPALLADQERPVALPLSENSPKIDISETTFDFGILEGDVGGTHDFVVKNIGKSSLTLKLGHKSCSCTDIIFSTTSLSPGKEAKITLIWNNRQSVRGAYSHGATILTNDPLKEEFVINVVGNYSAPIFSLPNTVTMQGVMSGKRSTAKFRVFGFEDPPLEIQGFEWNDKEHFNIEVTKSELTDQEKEERSRKGAKSVYDGLITVEPGLPLGHFRERFRMISNSVKDKSFAIPLEGQMIGNFQVISPDYDREKGILDIGQTRRGVPLVKNVVIQFAQHGGEAPVFEMASVRPEWLKATLGEMKETSGTSRTISLAVEVTGEAFLGTFRGPEPEQYGEIMIKTNLEGLGEIRIPVAFVVEGGI